MPHTNQNPVLVRAADAEVLSRETTSPITLLTDSDAAGGILTSHRTLFREGSTGAPPHFHKRSAELFFVLSGSLQVLLGEEIVTLEQSDFLLVPPHVPHAFAPPRGAEADVFFVFAPGVPRDDYYRLLDRVYSGQADPKEIGESQELYDNYYVESAAWAVQRAASSG
jgi:mannose-6-phosphate isomerase-like protein (cupin superfamily)